MPYADPEVHRERNRTRQKTPAGIENHARAVKRWREQNRERLAAHNAVNKALRRGKLVRFVCQVEDCGDPRSQAHHCDYGNRLGVVWLCDKHHKEAHRLSKDTE